MLYNNHVRRSMWMRSTGREQHRVWLLYARRMLLWRYLWLQSRSLQERRAL